MPSARSSQFASSLLLIGSRLAGGLDLHLEAPVSSPYVALTVEVLRAFEVAVSRVDDHHYRVQQGSYPGTEYPVEGDHSTASYFLAAAAVTAGRVRVCGLSPDSQQADAVLQRILADTGCKVRRGPDWIEVHGNGELQPLDHDMTAAPDLVPTLAVLALFSAGPSTLRGVGHLRHKESDRLDLLVRNLKILGRPAQATADRLEIGPQVNALRGGEVITASDHRMAMAFAIAGLRIPGVVIDDANCVGKSNPGFWNQLDALR
jgi:3-phosphoshikimate 1-carboxyvinyltransferase